MKTLFPIQKVAIFFLPAAAMALFLWGTREGYTKDAGFSVVTNLSGPMHGNLPDLQSRETDALWNEAAAEEIILDAQTTRSLLGMEPEKKKTSMDHALQRLQKDFALQQAFSTSV